MKACTHSFSKYLTNIYHVQICPSLYKYNSESPCAQEGDSIGTRTYDEQAIGPLRGFWFPCWWITSVHQSNLDPLFNQQRSEVRNISNLIRYAVVVVLLHYCLSTFLYLSQQWFSTLFSTENLICYLRHFKQHTHSAANLKKGNTFFGLQSTPISV